MRTLKDYLNKFAGATGVAANMAGTAMSTAMPGIGTAFNAADAIKGIASAKNMYNQGKSMAGGGAGNALSNGSGKSLANVMQGTGR